MGGTYSAANGINDAGQVVGSSGVAGTTPQHAFLYSGSGMRDLGTLGGSNSYGRDINNAGQIVGSSTTAGDVAQHAFLYSEDSGMQDLGTLGGATSFAFRVNEVGQVAGYASTGDFPGVRAFLYSAGSGMQDLGTLGGGLASYAWGLNDAGHVVGTSELMGSRQQHAFLFDGEKMWDLNDLVAASDWVISDARAINNRGDIAANGCSRTSGFCGALLLSVVSSVPEPASLNLACGGLLVVGLAVARRRKLDRAV